MTGVQTCALPISAAFTAALRDPAVQKLLGRLGPEIMALPQMQEAGAGAIVLVASVNARFGGSALSGPAYAASKGGLVTLARFLAREHAADGITTNARSVTGNVSALTSLFTATMGGPLVKTAAFSYGLSKAIKARKASKSGGEKSRRSRRRSAK